MNQGILFDMKLEDKKNLKYMFMTLGPLVRGILNCIHPVLIVDDTFFNRRYKRMLTTVFVDDNNQIYPIAFRIVDRESDDS